jgi:hypothetical protein
MTLYYFHNNGRPALKVTPGEREIQNPA